MKVSNTKSAKSFTILKRGGVNIGVIGVNTTQTKEQVFPGNLAFKANGKTLEIKISDSREREFNQL